MDDDHCYRAVQSRDGRFDGAFFTAVLTTGIYCRPSCPAITPKRANVRFFPSAAAAQEAGFRACKRCRPDAAPGSPEWHQRADLVGRAMRLIADGVVEREGVSGLAQRLHYSERQLHRQMRAEVGAGPLALARAHRVQSARTLLETTDMPISDVAFAAGFASIRQFNDTLREVFALTPTALRAAAAEHRPPAAPGQIALRLSYRPPLAFDQLVGHLAARVVPGVEECADGVYRRVLRLPHGTGVATVRGWGAPGAKAWGGRPEALECLLRLDDTRDFAAAVQRLRRLADLDADPVAVDKALGADPMLGPSVRSWPGLRVPGGCDGFEVATRAVIGQQVSLGTARSLAATLVAAHGRPLPVADGALTHAWPDPDTLADADPAAWPVPAGRRRALSSLARAVAVGKVDLDPGADRDDTQRALLALPGIGPWTAGYVRLRALGDPDTFLATDLGVRRALAALACVARPSEQWAETLSERWRPWRAYAMHHVWAAAAVPFADRSNPR